MNRWSEIGFIDDNNDGSGLAYLGTVNDFIAGTIDCDALVVAVGDNKLRESITSRIPDDIFASIIHPSAVVSPDAEIAQGTMILAQSVIATGVRVGSHSIVNHNTVIDHDSTVGKFVHLSPSVTLAGDVTVGDRYMAWYCR